MTTAPSYRTEVTGQQARNAFRAALLMLAAAAGYDVFVFYLAFQSGAWQLFAHAALMAAFCAAVALSAGLSWRGRPGWGIALQLAGLWLTVLTISATIAGMGVSMALISLALTTTIAGQMLHKLAGRVILAGVAVGAVALILDRYVPLTSRPDYPALRVGALIAAGALFLAYLLIFARQFRDYSLRIKLTASFVAVAVLVAGGVGFVIYRVVQAQLTQQAGANLNSLARSQAVTLSNELVHQLDLIKTKAIDEIVIRAVEDANAGYRGDPAAIQAEIAGLDQQWRAADAADNDAVPLVQRVLSNQAAAELSEFREEFSDHVEIFVTDRYGANVAATNRTSDYNQGDEAWWQAANNNGRGAVYVGQPEYDESSRTYATNMAVPLLDQETGEVKGILRTTYRLAAYAKILARAHFGETGDADLVFPSGELLRPEGDHAMTDPGTLEQLKATAGGYGQFIFEDKLRFVSQAPLTALDPVAGEPINALGWTIVVDQDPAEALRPVQAVAQSALFVGLGAMLFATLLAIVAAQSLANPITRLTAIADQVAGGDLTARARVESRDEIGVLASTFNDMAEQLRGMIGTLEQRVADRTRALALSSDISRRLSAVLDQKELISEVVEQVRSAFGYYHVHIYLYDPQHEYLVMSGGTGEAAQGMLARAHRIEGGRGLIGRAAKMNTPVLVPDVSKESGWLPNPLLPDTKAEAAVPIAIGGRVLGVLDVQQNTVGGLKQEDIQMIQSIANQVAIALQNTWSYERAQRQANREAFLNTLGQKIQSAATIESVLQTAAQELGQALGAQRATAHIGQARRDNDNN